MKPFLAILNFFYLETFDRSCATVEEQRIGWKSGKIYKDVTDSDEKYLREVEEVYCSKGAFFSKYKIIYGDYVCRSF